MTTDSLVAQQALEENENILQTINGNVKTGVVDSVTDFTQYFERLIIWAVDMIPDVIRALVGLIIGLFIIRTTMKILKSRFEKRNVDPSLRGFLTSIIRFVLYALLILMVASNLGFQTTAILGAFSGLVLAVGLALQGSLSNFAGGVLILLFRPFEVGDYIENNSGTEGTVEKIDLLYTTLITAQGLKIFSPNGALANSVIKNFTKITNRRLDFVVGIGYEDNIKTAKETIIKILNTDERILQMPVPNVFVSELADSSVNLTIHAWAERSNYWQTRYDLQEAIKIALDEASINIPYPQTDVHIINSK